MKESLNYYYNLNIADLEKWETVYKFTLNNTLFYFVPLNRDEKELEDLLRVSTELKNHNLPIHDLVPNIFNKIVTNVYNTNYCLLKVNVNEKDEFSLRDLIKFNKSFILNAQKSNLYRISWSKLWSDKIDYFEYQISQIGSKKNIILNSLSYYIGLGENAISYFNNATKYKNSNEIICLSHKRVGYPNYSINYLNPLTFIFDLEVRDLAEYLKSAFFHNEDAISYLKEALRLNNYTIYSLSLLYSRLLYPTYYFDLYEKVMNNSYDEEILIPIIEKNTAYELFLKEAYYEISKYAPIARVEWLLKKEL